MAKKSVRTLDVPPFPPLTWNEFFWEGRIVLPAWSSFHRQEAKSEGVNLPVAAEDDNHSPTPEQATAFRYLIDHDKRLIDIILQEIVDEEPWWNCDDYEAEIEEAGHLIGRIRLGSILIHQVACEGTAYLGFGFGCEWDEEHGLGVMMHRDRVVAIGGCDVSILEWIARGDAEKAT